MKLDGVRWTRRLVGAFLVATLLPSAALGWLGWRLADQDLALERQRVQDFAESVADRVTAALERELGAVERGLGASPGPDGSKSASLLVTAIRLTRGGQAMSIAGAPLIYGIAAPERRLEPGPEIWFEAERTEFIEGNLAAAERHYRRLAASSDPHVRAGALIRLARVLRRAGGIDKSLHAYAAAAALDGATILEQPAELVARWARVETLASTQDQIGARREAEALDADLHGGRWQLSRTTFRTFADALRPWRGPQAETRSAMQAAIVDTCAALWHEWLARPAGPFSGRRSSRVAENDVLVAWREDGPDLLVYAAPAGELLRSWSRLWTTPNVDVAFMNPQGHIVAGRLPAPSGAPLVTRPWTDTRLPWTLRVAAAPPSEMAAAGLARRRLILSVLLMLAFLLPATGYLVARTVHKELALVRQQAAFVAAVSHEFRSPLTSLSHLTALLRSDIRLSDGRRRQYYDMLARETDRLRNLVETLLDLGRIRAGAARYRLSRANLSSLVTSVVDEFRQHAAAGAREVLLEAETKCDVRADREALARAIWNLLENAAKYSPVAAPITVRLEESDVSVRIQVYDRGVGIPAVEQPFIFDQFFRGSAAAESAVKGTGVGLAIVRHIVAAHGGDVRVDSTVGAGSSFTILLPALPPEETADDHVKRTS